MTGSTSSFVITNNRCGSVQTGPAPSPSLQRYGVEIADGGRSTDYIVTGNQAAGNMLGGVYDGVRAAQRVVQGNLPL